MYGDEAESFKKFPVLAERFIAVDKWNFCGYSYHPKTHHFQAAFFAPRGIQLAARYIWRFISINSTYTSSKFQMTLLIAVSINANDKTLLMA